MSLLGKKFNLEPTGRPKSSGALVAAGIAGLTLLIACVPGASEALQWHRDSTVPHRAFEWITGHMTHWSWDHLFWDLAAFLALSVAVLRLIPRRYLIGLLISAFVISLEIHWNQTGLISYRGLSGIDSALFGLLIAGLWKGGSNSGEGAFGRLLAVGAGAAFLAKTLYELISGHALFVSSADAGFIPAVSAHLTGMICGLIIGLAPGMENLKSACRRFRLLTRGIEQG